MSKQKKKKLIINANSSQLEVIIGEVKNEKVSLFLGQSCSISFDTQEDWESFVKYIVQLSPTEKIDSFLKPLLHVGDLVQWEDGALGLVIKVFLDKNAPNDISRVKFFGEQEETLWLYSIKWNDRNEISILSHEALTPRKFDKRIRWKLLSRVRNKDGE